MQELSEVNQALLDLQAELDRFKTAKAVLDGAHEEARHLIKQWQELHSILDESLQSIYQSAVKNSESVRQSVGQLHELGTRLVPLARAIEEVNFPSRFDRLDSTISTVMLTLQSVQNRFDLMDRNPRLCRRKR